MLSKFNYGTIKKRYGGGSGGGPTTVTESTIPKEFIPGLIRTQEATEAAFKNGQLNKVADANQNLKTAFTTGASGANDINAASQKTLNEQTGRLTDMAETGGADELKAALDYEVGSTNAKIGNDYGATGTLGSYRHNLASMSAEDMAKAKFAQQVIQNKGAAETALDTNLAAKGSSQANIINTNMSVGNAERAIEQQKQDASWQALQRYASTMYGNPARQSTQVVPAGGK